MGEEFEVLQTKVRVLEGENALLKAEIVRLQDQVFEMADETALLLMRQGRQLAEH